MKLKPLEDRVVVKALEEEEKTASGIVLPDTAKEKPMKGKVLAVGDGKWDEKGEKRVVLRLNPDLAPVKVAVLPLSRNEQLALAETLAIGCHAVNRAGSMDGA